MTFLKLFSTNSKKAHTRSCPICACFLPIFILPRQCTRRRNALCPLYHKAKRLSIRLSKRLFKILFWIFSFAFWRIVLYGLVSLKICVGFHKHSRKKKHVSFKVSVGRKNLEKNETKEQPHRHRISRTVGLLLC